jgi:hypothetical protein
MRGAWPNLVRMLGSQFEQAGSCPALTTSG